nr:glycoside hydrolase family 3 C-terminal domain-containing protein [Lachnospiraceae bacterium]
YKAQIDAGVKSIMITHSSLNGVKMHENKKYIDILKNDLGFEGFVISDWNSIQNTSPKTYYDQIVTCVNAGIDMLMEPDRFSEAFDILVDAVNKGDISEERIDDAVQRIIQVKLDLGVFEDPLCENIETKQSEPGSDEYRALAEKAVKESLVLLKNDGDVLPLKEGTSVYIMGPAVDDEVAQCGGWTLKWLGSPELEVPGVTSIAEGFKEVAEEYGITVYTKKKDAAKADVIILAVGEGAYAEWYGDTENIDLCGPLGLDGNKAAIKKANSYGKPVVTLVIAGRNVFVEKYMDSWDATVMCYLPGSEGQGIVKMLCGESEFSGKLPSPWYASNKGIEEKSAWLEKGYGM